MSVFLFVSLFLFLFSLSLSLSLYSRSLFPFLSLSLFHRTERCKRDGRRSPSRPLVQGRWRPCPGLPSCVQHR
ncbi:hypothetical protein F4775DRAFT_533433 [Biscogniauxia sp. FL1348]|nr:hypothetical protein F4775DRAFT_533433 [Biscogniauxia sp. FL1348]